MITNQTRAVTDPPLAQQPAVPLGAWPTGAGFGKGARAPLTLKQLAAAAAGSSRGCPTHDHSGKTANLRPRATGSQGEAYRHRRLQRRRAPRYTVVPTGGKARHVGTFCYRRWSQGNGHRMQIQATARAKVFRYTKVFNDDVLKRISERGLYADLNNLLGNYTLVKQNGNVANLESDHCKRQLLRV